MRSKFMTSAPPPVTSSSPGPTHSTSSHRTEAKQPIRSRRFKATPTPRNAWKTERKTTKWTKIDLQIGSSDCVWNEKQSLCLLTLVWNCVCARESLFTPVMGSEVGQHKREFAVNVATSVSLVEKPV